MKLKYLSLIFFGCCLMAAHATTLFLDDTSPEAKKKQEAFYEAWQKVESEKESMMASIHTNHVAPHVEEYQNHNIDIAQIAQQYQQGVVEQQRGERVYVFVTLDMPKQTLKKLAQDMRRVDGALVLRGFYEGSYKKTYQKIAELGLTDGHFQINPEAFHKYKIQHAPTFVLVKALGVNESLDMDGCALPENYIKISGDVSVSYALEKMLNEVKGIEDKHIIRKYLGRYQ